MIVEVTDAPSSLDAARAVHRAAMLATLRSLVAPRKVHVALDASRGVYQAHVGAATFDRASLRGEWITEAGALRRLLGCVRAARAGLASSPTIREGRAPTRTAHVDNDQMTALLARQERT